MRVRVVTRWPRDEHAEHVRWKRYRQTGIEAGPSTYLRVLALSRGKILLVGTIHGVGGDSNWSALKSLADGTLDMQFGTTRRTDVSRAFGNGNRCYDATVDIDGSILFAGRADVDMWADGTGLDRPLPMETSWRTFAGAPALPVRGRRSRAGDRTMDAVIIIVDPFAAIGRVGTVVLWHGFPGPHGWWSTGGEVPVPGGIGLAPITPNPAGLAVAIRFRADGNRPVTVFVHDLGGIRTGSLADR